jgi:hypothetical protein
VAEADGDRSRWQLLVAPVRLSEVEKRRRRWFFQLLYFSYSALNIALVLLFPHLWLPILVGGMCLLYVLIILLNRTVGRNVKTR